jgi:hypothetical protein
VPVPVPPAKHTSATVRIEVSAEGESTLPPKSKIIWQGIGNGCETEPVTKNLVSGAPIPASLPVCKVRFLVIVPGFNTGEGTVDVTADHAKGGDPIRVTVKHKGAMEIEW